MTAFRRAGDTDRASRPLGQATAACRRYFVHAALFSAFLNLLYLAPTLYMLQVYDRVLPTRGELTLALLTLIFVGTVAAIAALDLIRTRLLIRAGARLDSLLCRAILNATLRATGRSPNGRPPFTLREFDALRQTLTGAGMIALFDAPWTPIYLVACFLLHSALGVLALVGGALLTGLTWLNERGSAKPIAQATRMLQTSYAGVDATLATSGVAGALGMREAMIRRHVQERAVAGHLIVGASLGSAGFVSAIKAFRLLLQSLALGLGALLAVEQQISTGAIFAASLLIARALQPVELVNGAWKNIIQARNAWRAMRELLESQAEEAAPTRLPTPVGAVAIENVTVLAPENRSGEARALIDGITVALAPGEMLGIVGPSGAGKSTLVKALVGELAAARGAVRYDGAALPDWPEDQIGAAIGYVPQEPTLFRGTIKDNIARFQTDVADPGTLDEEVVRVAQLCGAHDFILRLPNAYETELGWGGRGLSLGQAQRIALARALFGRPAVLILDEPNASLDTEGEAKLMETLEAARRDGTTVIVVAHRLGILAAVDTLLMLRDGRVELLGPRHAVLTHLQARSPRPAPQPMSVAAAS